jgi:hypothetical protein
VICSRLFLLSKSVRLEDAVKILDRLRTALWRADDIKTQLFAFLGSDQQDLRFISGRRITREEARTYLQELLPAEVQVRGICTLPHAIVVAAPHVHFDHWSEYFCNRVARKLNAGWVVAVNFRDGDSQTIPVPIGRHIHVNRPFESSRPGSIEYESDRARDVYDQYIAALRAASGHDRLPLDLLIEFHAHHRTPHVEIATAGLSMATAQAMSALYERECAQKPLLPELRLEPLHEVRLTAETAKRAGSLQPTVTHCALHIEIPREARQSEQHRQALLSVLLHVLNPLLNVPPAQES